MSPVNLTIVPDILDENAMGPEFPEELPEGPLSTWDEPLIADAMGPARTPAEAVDWFIEAGDERTDDDDLPRLPVARTDEVDGPPSVTLDEEIPPTPVPVGRTAAPKRSSRGRRIAAAGLLATGLMGVGIFSATAGFGILAAGAGAATVWLVSGSAQASPAFDATAAAPELPLAAAGDDAESEAAEVEASEVEATEPEPVAAPSEPVAAPSEPVVAPRAPVAAPEAPPEATDDAPRRPRPPIVRPLADAAGEADAAPRTVKVLTTPPAARILVDGEDLGRTPLKASLPVGTHTVVLEQGGVRSTLDVTVDAGTDPSRLCFTATDGVFAAGACP